MDTKTYAKTYGIASRLDGKEYLMMNDINGDIGMIAYHTSEEARSILITFIWIIPSL